MKLPHYVLRGPPQWLCSSFNVFPVFISAQKTAGKSKRNLLNNTDLPVKVTPDFTGADDVVWSIMKPLEEPVLHEGTLTTPEVNQVSFVVTLLVCRSHRFIIGFLAQVLLRKPEDTFLFGECKVKDLRTLLPPTWLNDTVIMAYLRLVAQKCSPIRVHVFDTNFSIRLTQSYEMVRRWSLKVSIVDSVPTLAGKVKKG